MAKISVRLPRTRNGNEILEAFRNAATFQDEPFCKWVAIGFDCDTGEAVGHSTFVQRRGMRATPAHVRVCGRIQQMLFGRKTPSWKTDKGVGAQFATQIQLEPILPHEQYSHVMLSIYHEYDFDVVGVFRIASSPDTKDFNKFRPAYDRIVREFMRRCA